MSAGGGGKDFNRVQTGHVNKEFQGVAALDWKDGKPQSQIGISHSQGPTQDPAGDYSTIELERGPSDIKKKSSVKPCIV